ncbi:MAG: copper chaperone PCu(A)C [Gemmatimonadales bacterium]
MQRPAGILLVVTGLGVACGPPAPIRARAQIGALEITDGFAREPIIQASGAAYLTIHNTGSVADTLLMAESPEAAGAMFHGQSMSHLDQLPIPPGATVALAPGGTHLMLTDFARMPVVGDSLTLILDFAHAGKLTFKVPVRPVTE